MTTLITGANRGIGLALAKQLAAQGESVIGTTRAAHPQAASNIEWQQLDVAAPASHAALSQRLGKRPLSLLVCNAGVYLDRGSGHPPEKLWTQTFAVNVTGLYLTIESLLPNVIAGRGKIAIISSNMGSDARASGGSYVYRASKAAALNLGRNLAVDLKGQGIAVGVYHPGWVKTDMGGAQAHITVAESAAGLAQRFAALSLANTGCFENYNGEVLPF